MSLKKQATTGLVWTFAQQFGNQALGFIVSLVLARILLPAEFGIIGMITVFVGIGKALLNSGLTQSLIRTKNITNVDLSTVFFYNLIVSILFYGIIYLSAPLIADFYNQPILVNIIRVFSITFIISAFAAVQGARLIKLMNFKLQAIISLPSTIIGGVVGIIMAYMGYGVWSLVWSSLISSFINTLQLWIFSKWKPQFLFDFKIFRYHFNYGYKLAISSLLSSIFDNIYTVVIGRFFTPAYVGFYTRAMTVNQLPVFNLTNALEKVTFPLFSKIQDNDLKLKEVYKKIMTSVMLVIVPVLIIFAVLGEPLFRFLFTEKWLPAVPYFQILCIAGILQPIQKYNLNILKVKGRSDLFLKIESFKQILTVLIIILTINGGIFYLLWGQVAVSILNFYVNTHYSGKFIDYGAWNQIKDFAPILSIGLLMGVIVYLIDLKFLGGLNDFLRLLIGTVIGFIIYSMLAFLFNRPIILTIKDLIKK